MSARSALGILLLHGWPYYQTEKEIALVGGDASLKQSGVCRMELIGCGR